MSEILKRERSANWEPHEKQLLKELIKPYLNILNSKECRTDAIRAKQNAWTEITYKFNLRMKTLSNDKKKNYRHKKQVLAMWRRMKNARRKMLMANQTKPEPILLAPSVNGRETLETFKMESSEYEYECDSVDEENPLGIPNSVVGTIVKDCNPSPLPLMGNSQEESPLGIPNTVVGTIVKDCSPSPLPLMSNSQNTEFEHVIVEEDKDIECKETSTQTSLNKNTNGNRSRNRNLFRFSDEFYKDMRYYRDMENDRMEKEHLLRVKTMEEQHKQVIKNLQLQEEILKMQLNKFN